MKFYVRVSYSDQEADSVYGPLDTLEDAVECIREEETDQVWHETDLDDDTWIDYATDINQMQVGDSFDLEIPEFHEYGVLIPAHIRHITIETGD